jgi:hypothetical protein
MRPLTRAMATESGSQGVWQLEKEKFIRRLGTNVSSNDVCWSVEGVRTARSSGAAQDLNTSARLVTSAINCSTKRLEGPGFIWPHTHIPRLSESNPFHDD